MISLPVAVASVEISITMMSLNDGLEMFSVNVTDSWSSLMYDDNSLKHMKAKTHGSK